MVEEKRFTATKKRGMGTITVMATRLTCVVGVDATTTPTAKRVT